jgi:hypothetical protein
MKRCQKEKLLAGEVMYLVQALACMTGWYVAEHVGRSRYRMPSFFVLPAPKSLDT